MCEAKKGSSSPPLLASWAMASRGPPKPPFSSGFLPSSDTHISAADHAACCRYPQLMVQELSHSPRPSSPELQLSRTSCPTRTPNSKTSLSMSSPHPTAPETLSLLPHLRWRRRIVPVSGEGLATSVEAPRVVGESPSSPLLSGLGKKNNMQLPHPLANGLGPEQRTRLWQVRGAKDDV
jgi:hypothetical protein